MESKIDLDERPSRIAIDRPVYRQSDFDRRFFNEKIPGKNADSNSEENCCSGFFKKHCTKEKVRNTIFGMLPVIDHWKTYDWKKYVLYDIIAGFSAGVIHLPQGLGFSLLAGVPPVFGLYTSFLPGWIYYIFGTSRHLSYGTMAVLALMVGSFVNKQEYDVILSGNGTVAGNNSIQAIRSGFTLDAWNSSNPFVSETTPHLESIRDFENHPSPPVYSSDQLRVNAAALLTLTVGLLQIFMSALKLGVVSTFMSLPFVKSFTAGAAVHIVINQIPFQLGFKVKRASGAFQLPINVYRIGSKVFQTNMAALLMSVVCMVFLLLTKEVINRKLAHKLKFPIPAELIVVVVSTVVSYFAEFSNLFNMRITGSIPTGFPAPMLPSIFIMVDEDSSFFGTLAILLSEAVPIAIIGFALAITMAKLMAERHNYEVDSNYELLASGLVNGFCSFFGCIASTQAPPRTLVLESCGCKSRLAGLISTILPFVVVILAGSLFSALPICVLGSVVSAAMLPLIVLEFIDFIPLWRVSKGDCLVWMLCFLATVFVDVGAGLLLGILASGLVIMFGNKGAKGRLLKRAGSTEIYVSRNDVRTLDGINNNNDDDVSKCVFTTPFIAVGSEKKKVEGESGCNVAIFRFECSLYFVNAESFKNTLINCVLKSDVNKIVSAVPGDKSTKKKRNVKCCYRITGEEKPANEKVALKSFKGDNASVTKEGTDQHPVSEAKVPLESPIQHVILDFSRISDVDVTGLNALKCVIKKLDDNNVSVSICCCPEKTRKRLEASGVVSGLSGPQWEKAVPLYPSIVDAHAFCTGQVVTL